MCMIKFHFPVKKSSESSANSNLNVQMSNSVPLDELHPNYSYSENRQY